MKDKARKMLDELEAGFLDVVLMPAPEKKHEGHCVRAVQSQNAEWYQAFCELYPDSPSDPRRRIRTKIRRQRTVKALEEIIDGKTDTIYAERLLEFMDREEPEESPAEDYDPEIPF